MVEAIENIREHKLIPREPLAKLVKTLVAVDNAISLQYTNHQLSPLLTKVLDSASKLANIRINVAGFESLLFYDKSMYQVYKLGTNSYDYSKIYVKFPVEFNQINFVQRKQHFITKLNDWIEKNQDISYIPGLQLQNLLTSTKPSKIVKKSPTKRVSHDLINSPSKFKFIEKDELIQQQKNQGLSLIERIKLKEKLACKSTINPVLNYQNYLLGKTKTIYDIIYQYMLNEKETTIKSFSMQKLTENIKDSLDYPLTSEEVVDIIKLLQEKLDRDNFVIVSRQGLLVLKVGKLNRDQDLKALQ